MARTKEGEVARGLTREDSSSIMIQNWIFLCSVVGGVERTYSDLHL